MEKIKEKYCRMIKKTLYIILILAVITAIFLFICCYNDIAEYFFGKVKNINSKGELLKIALTTIGGIVGIIALYFHYKRTQAIEKQTQNQTEQIKITEKGQVDERFKNAIEQLGNENEAIVLGGIHSLHRIAFKSETYRKTVFDILCSYIRQHSKEIVDKEKRAGVLVGHYMETPNTFQTIINLLFKHDEKTIYNGLRADLTGAYLVQADLNCAHLVNAILFKTNLESATLINVNLCNANLAYADLSKTILMGARFEHASLKFANFKKAIVIPLFIKDAYLAGKKLEAANFSYADLEGVKLKDTQNLNKAIGLEYSHFLDRAIIDISNTTHKEILEKWKLVQQANKENN